MNEQPPPRSYLDDDRFMAAWSQMAPVIRSEVLRAEREIRLGKAIQKDRMMGRGKYDVRGFYGLELAEEKAYQLEQAPRKAGDLEEARKRVGELQAALAEDEKHVERVIARDADLEPFHQMAAASGTTVAEYLRRACTIEQAFYRAQAALRAGDGPGFTDGMLEGLCQLGDRFGFDPVQVLLDAYRGPQAVTH